MPASVLLLAGAVVGVPLIERAWVNDFQRANALNDCCEGRMHLRECHETFSRLRLAARGFGDPATSRKC